MKEPKIYGGVSAPYYPSISPSYPLTSNPTDAIDLDFANHHYPLRDQLSHPGP